MASVRAAQTLPGTVHEVETAWYDTSRWPAWVEGLARVTAVDGEWPRAGSGVSWESGPAGRGRVRERVLDHEPRSGQTVAVEDDSIQGRQTVRFTPTRGGVEMELTLQYALKRRSILTPVVDLLFIRRAMANSLRDTLARFESEVAAARRSGVG